MKEQLERIKAEALQQIEASDALDKLNEIRVAYLGKKGELTSVLKSMNPLSNSGAERCSLALTIFPLRISLKDSIIFFSLTKSIRERSSFRLILCRPISRVMPQALF